MQVPVGTLPCHPSEPESLAANPQPAELDVPASAGAQKGLAADPSTLAASQPPGAALSQLRYFSLLAGSCLRTV